MTILIYVTTVLLVIATIFIAGAVHGFHVAMRTLTDRRRYRLADRRYHTPPANIEGTSQRLRTEDILQG